MLMFVQELIRGTSDKLITQQASSRSVSSCLGVAQAGLGSVPPLLGVLHPPLDDRCAEWEDGELGHQLKNDTKYTLELAVGM